MALFKLTTPCDTYGVGNGVNPLGKAGQLVLALPLIGSLTLDMRIHLSSTFFEFEVQIAVISIPFSYLAC